MLHFNAPPTAALKPAAGVGDEDVYKVLILDRVTKVRQRMGGMVSEKHARNEGRRQCWVCGLLGMPQRRPLQLPSPQRALLHGRCTAGWRAV